MKPPNSVAFFYVPLRASASLGTLTLFLYDTVIEIFKNFGVRTVASVLALFLCRILGVRCEDFLMPALSYELGQSPINDRGILLFTFILNHTFFSFMS